MSLLLGSTLLVAVTSVAPAVRIVTLPPPSMTATDSSPLSQATAALAPPLETTVTVSVSVSPTTMVRSPPSMPTLVTPGAAHAASARTSATAAQTVRGAVIACMVNVQGGSRPSPATTRDDDRGKRRLLLPAILPDEGVEAANA